MAKPPFRSEPLANHDRAHFSSGVSELDEYFRQRITQDQKRSISVPYVFVDNQTAEIVGYYTLSNSTVQLAELPPDLARKLPRYESFGAILIGRLALDQRYQGRGLGRRLLVDALNRCFVLSQKVGIYAVLVDAKDERARGFYEHVGFHRQPDNEWRLYIPMKAVAILLKSLPGQSATDSTQG